MSLQNLIKSLENGICPAELNFSKNNNDNDNIDWEKVRYNTFYKSPEFFESKFPNEILGMNGFDKVIDLIVEKNINNTPLKEIITRENIDELVQTE